jgi:acetyltransferase-like isoleucine patch superfamily enzyme
VIFFTCLKVLNKLTSIYRKVIYNLAFSTHFKYFGKRTQLEISGQVHIGNNVYIGDNVTLIVEKGATLTIGDNSFIGESCYIKCFGGHIEIGQDVSINSKSFLNGCGNLKIGKNTRIGTQSIMIASNHKFDDPDVLYKDQITKQGISIGENIWFGARVTILDGVNISNNVVIGACSLVTKNINESGVYVGIPAKKLMKPHTSLSTDL